MTETTKKTSRFDGSAALVTGASRGLGLAVARRLAERGARLCITARDWTARRRTWMPAAHRCWQWPAT